MPVVQASRACGGLFGTRGHHLIETGICPSADGLIRQGWYDGAESARPWLQFFNRLPRTLQAQVSSQPGLAFESPVRTVLWRRAQPYLDAMRPKRRFSAARGTAVTGAGPG